jgi:hypothetical protein
MDMLQFSIELSHSFSLRLAIGPEGSITFTEHSELVDFVYKELVLCLRGGSFINTFTLLEER